MRLWSLHPDLLDRAGLVAGWREGLLAQKVLRGATRGYTRHPQLVRFVAESDPVAAVTTYLHALADEADARGYRFDRTRVVAPPSPDVRMSVTTGQLDYEWDHLHRKLAVRDPDRLAVLTATRPRAHPVFEVVDGPIAAWEVR